MNLFLQGPICVGKSTILRNTLLPYEQNISGLVIQRLFEDGVPCGFRACTVNGALPALEEIYTQELNGVFLYKGQSFPEVLEHAARKALELCSAERCQMIILDEIGGLELFSSAFMLSVHTMLRLNKPCIGVIKSHENLAHTARRLNLPADILDLRDTLQQELESKGRVVTVTPKTHSQTAALVNGFVKKAFL